MARPRTHEGLELVGREVRGTSGYLGARLF